MECWSCHREVNAAAGQCIWCFAHLDGPPVDSFRPADAAPFEPLTAATLRMLSAGGSLVLLGAGDRLEANVVPDGPRAHVVDVGGKPLFDLGRWGVVDDALVATLPDGQPLATYLHDGDAIAVRDDASAPAARATPVAGRDDLYLDVTETGGGRLASVWRQPHTVGRLELDDWVLGLVNEQRVLHRWALVALPIVCALRWPRPPRQLPPAGTWDA